MSAVQIKVTLFSVNRTNIRLAGVMDVNRHGRRMFFNIYSRLKVCVSLLPQ